MQNDGRFVDFGHIMSYNALFSFIVGQRTGGKSYGAKKVGIKGFIKKGRQFLYVRRFKSDLKKIGKFFDDIAYDEEFVSKKYQFEVKRRQFFLNDALIGEAVALSEQETWKSTPLPNVDLIIFDEFIMKPKGMRRYIPDEVNEFKELYTTVARMGTDHPEVKVLFLGNLLSMVNPYFDYYNISLPYEGKTIFKNDILIYHVKSQQLIEEQKKSRFYKIHGDDNYNQYAIEGKVLIDTNDFISKKEGKCEYQFMLLFNDNVFGIWQNYSSKLFYVSYDIDPSYKLAYTTDINCHNENTRLVKRSSQDVYYRRFLTAYKDGEVRFESKQIKNKMMPWLGRYVY